MSTSAAKGKPLFSQSSVVWAVGECMNIFQFISGSFELGQSSVDLCSVCVSGS